MKLTRRKFVGGALTLGGGTLLTAQTATAASIAGAGAAVPNRNAAKAKSAGSALEQALAALDRHAAHITQRDRIGIADYVSHSREFRFHIADVGQGKITRSFLVSHGRGSDPANSGYAQSFSNLPGSNASSRGSFLTGEAYVGKHGRSRRLYGLEDQNDRAFERAIVIHGADYVDHAMARNQGRVGRSLGCFAFEQNEIATILELLGEGRLLFAAGDKV